MLQPNELIEKFHERLLANHPELLEGVDLKHLRIICRSPFSFLISLMKQPTIPNIRFTYFGVFKVHTKTIKQMLYNYKLSLEKQTGRVTPEYVDKVQGILDYRLNNELLNTDDYE